MEHSGRVSTRAQIAVFLLLMAVLAGSFVFIIHLSTSSQKGLFLRQQPLDATHRMIARQMEHQIQQCIDIGYANALRRVAHGGGYIFNDSEQKPFLVPFDIPAEAINRRGNVTLTAYQIYNPLSGRFLPNYHVLEQPPFYPCLRQPYDDATLQTILNSLFGADIQAFNTYFENYGYLCHTKYNSRWASYINTLGSGTYQHIFTGARSDPNDPSFFLTSSGFTEDPQEKIILPSLCRSTLTTGTAGIETIYTCPTYANMEYSIEEQIAAYVIHWMDGCVNVSAFESFGGHFEASDVFINITFETQGTTLRAHYPITIEQNASMPRVTRFYDFESKSPVRLLSLYKITRHLIDQDTKNFSFDFEKDGNRFVEEFYNGEFLVQRRRIGERQHINRITDLSADHALNAEPYSFQFMSENRIPALDRIHRQPFIWNGVEYDYYVMEGEPINFTPLAFDPDEDNLTYIYTGWKATWDDVFIGPGCGGASHTPPQWTLGITDPSMINVWHTSLPYTDGCSADDRTELSRCGYLPTTTCQDIGGHTITISAQDQQNYADYQEIRILVDDRPHINVWFNNTYEDINDGSPTLSPADPAYVNDYYASVEDPFLINASTTTDLILIGGLLFQITDLTENPNWVSSGPGGYLRQEPWKPPIADPGSGAPWIMTPGMPFTTLGPHQILVQAQDSLNGYDYAERTYEILVNQCLPHRASGTAPYPYHILPVDDAFYANPKDNDPYQADHTCCKNTYDYFDSSKICYALGTTPSNTLYGCATDFIDNTKFPIQLFRFSGNPTLPAGAQVGDILTYHFERSCSGTRGNTCEGPVVTNQLNIHQSNPATGADATCHHCQWNDGTNFVNEQYGNAWDPTTGISAAANACNNIYRCTNLPNNPDGYNKLKRDNPGATAWATTTYGTIYLCKGTCSGPVSGLPYSSCLGTLASLCNPTPCTTACNHGGAGNDYCT